jgi:hypothetical protein
MAQNGVSHARRVDKGPARSQTERIEATTHREENKNSRNRQFKKYWKKKKMKKADLGAHRSIVGTECEISVGKRRSRPKLSIAIDVLR